MEPTPLAAFRAALRPFRGIRARILCLGDMAPMVRTPGLNRPAEPASPDLDATLAGASPPSSRGLGRHPFKVEIRGSNPLGGTPAVFSRKTVVPAASTRFLRPAGHERRRSGPRSERVPPVAPGKPQETHPRLGLARLAGSP